MAEIRQLRAEDIEPGDTDRGPLGVPDVDAEEQQDDRVRSLVESRGGPTEALAAILRERGKLEKHLKKTKNGGAEDAGSRVEGLRSQLAQLADQEQRIRRLYQELIVEQETADQEGVEAETEEPVAESADATVGVGAEQGAGRRGRSRSAATAGRRRARAAPVLESRLTPEEQQTAREFYDRLPEAEQRKIMDALRQAATDQSGVVDIATDLPPEQAAQLPSVYRMYAQQLGLRLEPRLPVTPSEGKPETVQPVEPAAGQSESAAVEEWKPSRQAIAQAIREAGGHEQFQQIVQRRLDWARDRISRLKPGDAALENLQASVRMQEARLAMAQTIPPVERPAPRAARPPERPTRALGMSSEEGWSGWETPPTPPRSASGDAVPPGAFDDRDVPVSDAPVSTGAVETTAGTPPEPPEPDIPRLPRVEESQPGQRGDEREPAPPAPPASPSAERPSFDDEATKARLASGSAADRVKAVREFLFEAADKEKARLTTPERIRELLGDAVLEKLTKQALGHRAGLTEADAAAVKAAGLTPQDVAEFLDVAQETREEAVNEVVQRGSMKGKVARAALKNMPYWVAGMHLATVVTNPLVGLGLLGTARLAHHVGGKLKGRRERQSAERKLAENLQKDPAVYAEFQNRILEAMSAQRRRALLQEGKLHDEYAKNVGKDPAAAEAEFERVLTEQRAEKMRKVEERLRRLDVPPELATQLLDAAGRMYEMDQRTVRSERMLDQRLKLGNSSLERLDRVLDRIPVLGARSSVGKVGNFIFFRGLSAIAREAPKFAYSLGGIAGWQGGRGAVELGQYAIEDIRKNRRLKARAGGASPERASARERLTPGELLANLNASIEEWRRDEENLPQQDLVVRLLAETRSRRNEFSRAVDKAAVDRALETVTEMTVLNRTARVMDTVGRLNDEMVAARKQEIGRGKRLALAKLGGGVAGVALGLAGVRLGRMDTPVSRWVQEHASPNENLRAMEVDAYDRLMKSLPLGHLADTSPVEAGMAAGVPHTPGAGAETPEQTAPPGPPGPEAGAGATAKFGVEDRSVVGGHEPAAHPEAAAAPKPEVTPEQLKLATVAAGSGEGIEHAYIRQLENDPEGYGFQGDPSNEQLVRRWAEVTAHRDAIAHGFVTKDGETRVHEGIFVLNKDHSVEVPEAKVYTYSHTEGNVPGTTRVISEQPGGGSESSAAAHPHEAVVPTQPKPPESQRAVDRFPLVADPDAPAFEAQAPIETPTAHGPAAETTAGAAPSLGTTAREAATAETAAEETPSAEQPAQTEPPRAADDDYGDEIPYTGRQPRSSVAARAEHTAESAAGQGTTEAAPVTPTFEQNVVVSPDDVRDLNVQAVTDQELVERCSRVPVAELKALAQEQHDKVFEQVHDARTTGAAATSELRRYAGILRALELQQGQGWQTGEHLTTHGMFTDAEQKLIDGKVHDLDALYRNMVRHGGPGGPAAREAFRQLSVWHTLQEAAQGKLQSGEVPGPETLASEKR